MASNSPITERSKERNGGDSGIDRRNNEQQEPSTRAFLATSKV